MSDQSITQSEFQRFQDQLILLKEGKYKLEEKCEFLLRKVSHFEVKCDQLERELTKANEFKNKFRNGRDLEILIDDNQVLRDRMSATESNFKLQNDILRRECESLLSENERLKCQFETYKLQNDQPNDVIENDSNENECDNDQQYKIRSLQFEVSKLIKEKENVEKESENLKILLEDAKIAEKELASRIDFILNEKRQLSLENDKLRELTDQEKQLYRLEVEEISRKNSEALQESLIKYDEVLAQNKQLAQYHSAQMDALKIQLNKEAQNNIQDIKMEFQKQFDKLSADTNARSESYEAEVESWTLKNEQLNEEWKTKLEKNEFEYTVKIAEIEMQNAEVVTKLEHEITNLKESLKFAEEELKLYGKKNQKLLKDVKKQLEKEMKMSQEAQSKFEVQSHESQNSQTKVHEYLRGSHPVYSTDDQSSLHSSSNNGAISDGQCANISVTDEELRNLLDRLTNVQNDHCEFKRKIEVLNQEKNQLIKTIKRQENIILNYIKNRGGSDSCDTSPDHVKRGHSTAEALTLNGLMSSPLQSKTSLNSLLNKVKSTIKSISTQDILPLSSEKYSYRVSDVDVKQLQRVCEELMMRCLNLETDLQCAVDLNIKMTNELEGRYPCSKSFSSFNP